jgi:hypothetical protein
VIAVLTTKNVKHSRVTVAIIEDLLVFNNCLLGAADGTAVN